MKMYLRKSKILDNYQNVLRPCECRVFIQGTLRKLYEYTCVVICNYLTFLNPGVSINIICVPCLMVFCKQSVPFNI